MIERQLGDTKDANHTSRDQMACRYTFRSKYPIFNKHYLFINLSFLSLTSSDI